MPTGCVTLSETWLTDESDDGQLLIEGYTLVRQDRAIQGLRPSGGIATYVKDGLTVSFTELSQYNKNDLDL